MRPFPKKKKAVGEEQACDPGAVYQAAVGLLVRRDFCSGELREKLESQGYDPGIVSETIEELIESKSLNDARYAEHYVAYHASRGQGPVRIAADLKALRLPTELIDAALATIPQWQAHAREVRSRKFGLDVPTDWTEKSRQARFLQYRGFSADHIRAALGSDLDLDE